MPTELRSGVSPGRDVLEHETTVALTFVIMAGGRSRRFGSNKLMATVCGVPLLQQVIAAVPEQLPVVVAGTSFAPDLRHRIEATVVSEQPAYGGPLSGLLAALPHVSTPFVAVVGGDMPYAVPGALTLAGFVDPESPRPIVALDSAGRRQPLCSILPVGMLYQAVEQLGAARDRPLHDLFSHIEVQTVSLPDHLLVDVDHPEDLHHVPPNSSSGLR